MFQLMGNVLLLKNIIAVVTSNSNCVRFNVGRIADENCYEYSVSTVMLMFGDAD